MKRYVILALTAFAITSMGCNSFSTNFLHRDEGNFLWLKHQKLQGVPVTLKVPTHVRIDVTEKSYMLLNSNGIQQKSPGFPLRSVSYEPIQTEKIFLVDLKRPAAGTIGANLDFDADEQYFNSIKNEVDDQTIGAVSDLIGQIAPSGLIGTPTSEEQVASELRGRVKEVSTVVASKVFEFDAPDFEILVSEFLGKHLNCNHDCGTVSPLRNPLDNDLTTPICPTAIENPSVEGDEPEINGGASSEEGETSIAPFENPVSAFRIGSQRRQRAAH